MESANPSLATSFVIGALCLLVYLYAAVKQFFEVLEPRDWLSGLRWIILGVLLLSVLGIVPVLVYQGYRLAGVENEVLRNVASITGQISRLGGAILLLLIYNYKAKK